MQASPQVEEGAFVKEHFDELCWTLTAKKNYRADGIGSSPLSNQDAFRLWCLFNFLSEDKYPLIMVPDEVRVTSEPDGGVTEGQAPGKASKEDRVSLGVPRSPNFTGHPISGEGCGEGGLCKFSEEENEP